MFVVDKSLVAKIQYGGIENIAAVTLTPPYSQVTYYLVKRVDDLLAFQLNLSLCGLMIIKLDFKGVVSTTVKPHLCVEDGVETGTPCAEIGFNLSRFFGV